MPVEGIPDPALHRLCRRCGKWFEIDEGALLAPEVTGPLGAMRAMRASFDSSLLRFQCDRCTRIRRRTQRVLWGAFLMMIAIPIILEKLGIIK
jgi:hypothetical protein